MRKLSNQILPFFFKKKIAYGLSLYVCNCSWSWPWRNYDSDVILGISVSSWSQELLYHCSKKMVQLEVFDTKPKLGEELKAYAPLTTVCDGCFSNLRHALCSPKVQFSTYTALYSWMRWIGSSRFTLAYMGLGWCIILFRWIAPTANLSKPWSCHFGQSFTSRVLSDKQRWGSLPGQKVPSIGP